jgi:hypothetical protein
MDALIILATVNIELALWLYGIARNWTTTRALRP